MIQDVNASLRMVRTAVFGVACLSSSIALALCASIMNYTSTVLFYDFPFAGLGIASGILTLLTLPFMLYLSMTHKSAATSFELGWTLFLWILWLPVGEQSLELLFHKCGPLPFTPPIDVIPQSVCQQSLVVTVFGFLTALLLFFYNITIFAFVIRQHMHGNTGVWNGYITETDFVAVGPNLAYPKLGRASIAPQYGVPGVGVAGVVSPVQQQYPVQQQMPPPQQTPAPYPQA